MYGNHSLIKTQVTNQTCNAWHAWDANHVVDQIDSGEK